MKIVEQVDTEYENDLFGLYATIPVIILLDNSLKPITRILYAVIVGLCKQRGYCWATNSFLAIKIGYEKTVVSRMITELQEHGYIVVDPCKEVGNKRKIWIDFQHIGYKNTSLPKSQEGIKSQELLPETSRPIDQKVKHNNIKEENNLLSINIQNENGIEIPESWNTIQFINEFDKVIKYKKQKSKSKIAQVTQNELVKQLIKVSHGDFEKAKEIIARTIRLNYPDFYELPKEYKPQPKDAPPPKRNEGKEKRDEEKFGLASTDKVKEFYNNLKNNK